MTEHEEKLIRAIERIKSLDDLMNMKEALIEVLKSENSYLRKIVSALTGTTDWKPGDEKKKNDQKFPPMFDEKEDKYREMSKDEKQDYLGTLNAVLGTSIAAE